MSSTFYFFVFVVLAMCLGANAAEKIGAGYRLVSVEETADGGLLGLLEINRKNKVYGPDIKHLQLYIKY